MKLLQQILSELGADTRKSMTVVPGFGGYFQNIKGVAEFSASRVVMEIQKGSITVEGENLKVGEYFEGDVILKGKIEVVKIEGAQ